MHYSVSFFYFFRHDSLQKHCQIAALDMVIAGLLIGQDEATPLQAFIPEGQAVPVPIEEFDHATSPIDEDEEGPGEGIGPQFATNDAAESVE